MNIKTYFNLFFIFSFGFALADIYLSPAFAEESDVVIIVNKDAPDQDLSKDKIKNIFTGKLTMWSSNESIVIAVLKDNQIHKEFLKKYVKRNPSQFKNTWRQLMFTGKASKPKYFETIEELVHFVSNNRLAIGYIKKDAADDKIKIIIP